MKKLYMMISLGLVSSFVQAYVVIDQPENQEPASFKSTPKRKPNIEPQKTGTESVPLVES